MLVQKEIDEILFPLTLEEQQFKRTNNLTYSPNYKKINVNGEEVYLFDDLVFNENEKLTITPHARFSRVPIHVHSYIELIYVYKGVCKQIIKGKEVQLVTGEFCILDKRVPHRVLDTSLDDIIINVLLKESYFTHAFLNRLNGYGCITKFLTGILYNQANRDSYIVFHSSKNKHLQIVMETIIKEFQNRDQYTEALLENYINILFIELLRVYEYEWISKGYTSVADLEMTRILSYINENIRNCTLKEVAQRFNFNTSYLSTLIKKHTSYTFSELIKKERIRQAEELLVQTDLTVEQIITEVGYGNKSFFYKQFRDHSGMTPNEWRNKYK
ncbi:AraC family transcriptional regulator [Priestia megaterium]